MSLLVLLACAGSSTKPESIADSGQAHEALPAGPASDVPGWRDATCTQPKGVAFGELRWPDLFRFEGRFLAGVATQGPHQLALQLHDCVGYACKAGATELDTALPYLSVTLDGAAGPYPQRRGQGEWGPDAASPRAAQGSGRSLIGEWSNVGAGTAVAISTCLSRVRPDEVRGFVRTVVPVSWQMFSGNRLTEYTFIQPFVVHLPDRSGFNSTRADAPADKPTGFDTAHFTYDVPYARAWPWGQITDASIRDALYQRYRPYNDP